MLVSQLNNYTLSPVSDERVSEAAGVNSAAGSFGLSFGLAFAGAIMSVVEVDRRADRIASSSTSKYSSLWKPKLLATRFDGNDSTRVFSARTLAL